MKRRGQCRCGKILTFRLTDQGYKTRCPSCASVVRLRPELSPPPPPQEERSEILAPWLLRPPPPPPPADDEDLKYSAELVAADPLDALAPPVLPDLSLFSDHGSDGPVAMAEMVAYREPEPRISLTLLLVIGLLVGLVLAAALLAAILLGGRGP